MPSGYFLLFINALIHLLSTARRSTMYIGAESEQKICADHEYLQPLIILIRTLIYSYILVHTGIYAYILVHTIIQHYVLGIRLEPPCYDVPSLLHACAVHCLQHPSFLRSPWWPIKETHYPWLQDPLAHFLSTVPDWSVLDKVAVDNAIKGLSVPVVGPAPPGISLHDAIKVNLHDSLLYDIVYDIAYDVVCYIAYDVVYDIVYDIVCHI